MAAVIAAYVWRTTPFNILLYHAALQGIPRELYEAAEVDGASGVARSGTSRCRCCARSSRSR